MASGEGKWPSHSRFVSYALGIWILIDAVGAILFIALKIEEISPELSLLKWVALAFIIIYWLDRDNRMTNIFQAWDRGWFFLIAWPVLLPYYLFKTRGAKKAALILFTWMGLSILATLNAMVIGVLWPE